MNRNNKPRAVCLTASFCFIASFLAFCATAVGQDATVSLRSLLRESTDRGALALAPNYTCKQASSYDRAAKSPEENWFANNDTAQFIRSEKNGDREEWVLMEADGPGAIVRWWITAPHYKNNVYVYVDGELAFSGKLDEYVGGNALVGAPMSEETSRGRNLYLPIPYAKSVKVTVDQMPVQGNLYYQINYRTYPSDVAVESFSLAALADARELVETTNRTLLDPASTANAAETQGFKRRIPAEMLDGLYEAHRVFGPGAITEIDVKLTAEDLALATRNTAIMISFDGEETVWAPVGDFFGSGVGINPSKTWYSQTLSDGTMKSYWRMPFQKEARVSFVNFGEQDVDVEYEVKYVKTPWAPNSMYFHANWRQERGIQTEGGRGVRDWNYATLEGEGAYVGDVLSVFNPVAAWWGEGDEKIYVDDEVFPSHFGTGTEDYYGYAWCCPALFESPYHAQTRVEGPGNFGNSTVERFRILDGIPFKKSFKFDMEIWHWETCLVDYAVTTFWYGKPGARIAEGGASRDDLKEEAAAPVAYKHQLKISLRDFEYLGDATGGEVAVQNMKEFRKNGFEWKDDRQIWWRDGKIGDRMTLKISNVPKDKKKMVLGATVARDYGVAQFSLNGVALGEPVDFYNAPKVERRAIEFELPELTDDSTTLEIKIVGINPKSEGSMIGVDSIEFE